MDENVREMVTDIRTYNDFVEPYQTANSIVKAHLEGLQKDLERNIGHKAIHSIKDRIKKPGSILEKLERKNMNPDFDTAKENLTDIAGIRVTCYYIKDVYEVADILKKQLDAILVKESDYIANPKPNGYRSLHLILGVAVYGAYSKEYYPVEIQLRTLAMDFWASMEHQLCYKSERNDKQILSGQLKDYSNMLNQMEAELEDFY
ncbi:MAG: (p)ppGpp synthetase [Lachnospiraceae bacterium]|nr:(p)ppGpp synthetase [Lachnospiraceae bacterium]